MKNQNHNENHLLDKFLENEYENNPQTNQQHYHSHQPAASYTPAYPRHKHNRKNTAVIALLSAIFVVGVAILAIQLFRPMNTVNNKENMTGGNRSDNPEYFICLIMEPKATEARNLTRDQTMANLTYGDRDLPKAKVMAA